MLIFATVIVVCAFLSGVGKSADATKDNTSILPQETEVLHIMALFCDETGDRYFASHLMLDLTHKTARAEPVDCEAKMDGTFLSDVYKKDGLYPFASACIGTVSTEKMPFVKLNSNTFVIIADRLKNIVYNVKNNGKVLLTSRQTEQMLDNEIFSAFCVQYVESALSKNIKDEFLFIASVTENDLSYPRLYDILD